MNQNPYTRSALARERREKYPLPRIAFAESFGTVGTVLFGAALGWG